MDIVVAGTGVSKDWSQLRTFPSCHLYAHIRPEAGNFACGCQLYGKIEPVAVIVCGPHGVYALVAEATPVDLDQLRRGMPGLDDLVYQRVWSC